MIIVKFQGGLGNQLFQFAFGKYLSIVSNTSLYFDKQFLSYTPIRSDFTNRTFDLDIFDIGEYQNISNSNDYKNVNTQLCGWFYQRGWSFISHLGVMYLYQNDIKFNKNIKRPVYSDVYLDGYWQSEKYFLDIKDVLKDHLTFKNSLKGEALLISQLIQKSESVCLHVRRGDYINFNNIKQHGLCDINYYKKAQNILNSKLVNLKYFVFSDDIEWCKTAFKGEDYFFIEDRYSGYKSSNHLQLMTLCKYFIIANSSFSWWAAWLAPFPSKLVLAPCRWLVNPSIDTKDILPSNWIKI